MKILVLNGSPRKNGNVSNLLKKESDRLLKKNPGAEIIWENVSDLNFSFCHGCMACRSKGSCLLPEDDAHKIENEIKECDMLIVFLGIELSTLNSASSG